MNSESTPTDSRPPPKPPAILGPVAQTPPDDAREAILHKRVESLKHELASTLRNTEWPKDSASAAEELLSTISSSPDISNKTNRMTQEVQRLVERYVEALDNVRIQLRDASSKSEMKRWKFLERIRSLTSNRPSKCTLLFHTCQDEVSKVTDALNERLESERANEGADDLGSPPQVQLHPALQSSALDRPASTPRQGVTADDSATNSLLPSQPQSNTQEDRQERGPISDATLTIARKTFKSVEIASGSIPVVGNFVGAAAKVGLAFVEMLQTMDRNHSLAVDLGDHTSKLTKLLENFKKKSSADEQDVAGQIRDLHGELGRLKTKVEEWNSLGQFGKAFSSRDHAEALKEYQGTLQTAREEMQLLVTVDSRNMIVELENAELRKERRRLLKCLGDGQHGARGNTIEDIICFPGTRLNVLKRIETWIRDASSTSRVLWVSGMAGRGKSTIASTVIHNWKCRASCAIFHFRRGQSTVNSRVVCALARQLGNSLVSEVREAVLESVRENDGIGEPGRRLDEQFENLFVAPFEKLKNHTHPILIAVDALDECDNPKDAVDFIQLIQKHSSSFPTNVKFLLTCRPEDPILRHLESKQWCKEDLDLAPDVNHDLALFIQHACIQVRGVHGLSEDWPSSRDIEQLVQMSQGLFQWARTVVTYISNGSPVDRLWALLKRPSAWSGLDDLYHQILSKAFESVRLDPIRQDILRRVLGALVVAPHPVSLEVIATLYRKHEVFDEAKEDRIIPFLRKDVLADLNSLLFIPDSPAESMRLMHTSIQDLLASELRCKQQPFYIDSPRCHQQLANECFKIMLGSLRENICDLSDYSKSSLDVQDIVERVISKGLVYCCRAWSIHLMQGVKWPKAGENATTTELAHFETFSNGKIMYWLEVMSLVGATPEAITAARQVHQWLLQRPSEVPKDDLLAVLWNDVQRFVTTFLEPIVFGPLHIYISALPHCPTETEIWHVYGNLAKVRIVHGHLMLKWLSNLWTRSQNAEVKTVAFSPDGRVVAFGSGDGTIQLMDSQTGTTVGEPLTGHDDSVWSVCFSPDGKLLASASADETIQLWNSKTGAALGEPLSGHDSGLWCVCFSPSGKLLASGSVDKTVRLWSAETGVPVGEPLEGHSGQVIAVCFSPDGKLLASGSEDQTIRLWDPQTGAALGKPLTGHSDRVRSVRFCPNGSLLASGSDDNTICFWDMGTRNQVGEQLTGHNDGVNSVCFSPNAKVLASASDDKTIRLWDIQTGAALGEPLTGHSDIAWSVCFSPDGKLLASGSEDKTVRLWDPQAGAAVAGSLISHSAKVKSVRFSPDGKRVASVYDDHSIRLWDAQTGAAVGEPLTGHSDEVNSVCFSPDGKLLASGSDDCDIRLWDAQTGAAVGEPLTGHSDEVNSVCFSPDGKLLASGSNDWTIRLWDAQTGVAVGEPLRGHDWWVRSVCFSPDGKHLAFGSNDETIRLWDVQTGMQVGEPLGGHRDWIRSVCFSPDGKYLASGSDDRTIRLWDPQTRVAVGEPFEGHSSYVMSVSFSSDGTLLFARCLGGSLATWDVTSRQRCDTPRRPRSYANPTFQDHWITFGSSPFLWLPPQYWDMNRDGVALFGGMLAAFPNGSLSILDVSQVLGTLTNQL